MGGDKSSVRFAPEARRLYDSVGADHVFNERLFLVRFV